MNEQYLYDSHLHPELFDNEIERFCDNNKSKWFRPFVDEINRLVDAYNVSLGTAVHFGSSIGLVAFELTRLFETVFDNICNFHFNLSKNKLGLFNALFDRSLGLMCVVDF
jgi:hypothetical protein